MKKNVLKLLELHNQERRATPSALPFTKQHQPTLLRHRRDEMCHSCQNSCPSLGRPLLTTVQLSLPGVLVCCQGGSPRNTELLQQPEV